MQPSSCIHHSWSKKKKGLEGTDTLSRMTQSLENLSHVKVHEKIVSITLSWIIVCGDKCFFNNKVLTLFFHMLHYYVWVVGKSVFDTCTLLNFKLREMGKSIDEMECFTGALLDITIQQTIKCEFN